MEMISYGRQHIDEEDIQAVVDCLRSGAITQGPKIAEFEQAIANYVGARYAVAVSSCTTALHLAMIVAGIKHGDEVICPSLSFIARAMNFVNSPLFFIQPIVYPLSMFKGSLKSKTSLEIE